MGARKWECGGVQILLPQGVEVRDFGDREPKIGIRFKYHGVACRELSLSAGNAKSAAANVSLAHAKLVTIQDEIQRGVFKYGEHFPESKRCELFGEINTKGLTVGDLFDAYLADAKGKVEDDTHKLYTRVLELHARPTWNSRPVSMLATPTGLEKWLEDMAATGVILRTARNYIGPFDCALSFAVRKSKLKHNPFRDISLAKIWPKAQRESNYEPDPYNEDERAKILKTATAAERRMCIAWWWGGFRPEELVALKWSEVDFANERVRVCRVNRNGKIQERVKTKSSLRYVPMIGPAKKALLEQRDATRLKPHGFVFEYESTGKPFSWTHVLADKIWLPLLKRAGVRHRGPGQNRHTFASMMLEKGERMETVSKILGHKDSTVTAKCYARMIERMTATNKHGFKLVNDYSKVAA